MPWHLSDLSTAPVQAATPQTDAKVLVRAWVWSLRCVGAWSYVRLVCTAYFSRSDHPTELGSQGRVVATSACHGTSQTSQLLPHGVFNESKVVVIALILGRRCWDLRTTDWVVGSRGCIIGRGRNISVVANTAKSMGSWRTWRAILITFIFDWC